MRKFIARLLTAQAKRYINKRKPKIVVVTGSVGKTSTTQAIATVLSESGTVRATLKNYNSDVGVPCSIFGEYLPESLKNPVSWTLLLLRNELSLLRSDATNILVLELGTDQPGEIAQFAWLKPDIAVITAVAPEHMEFFKSLDDVAVEELAVAAYSDKLFVNSITIDSQYVKKLDVQKTQQYNRHDVERFGINLTDVHVVGGHSLDAVAAAVAVGSELDMGKASIMSGVRNITAQPGRMRVFEGVFDTVLIDDTYNASPTAVIAALDYLYSVNAPQRIVLLGNMNELGDISEYEHTQVGDYCDPAKLDLVVTLGSDANRFTAPAARAKSCTVVEADSPYEAGKIIRDHMKKGAHILLKGSQNGVFAEEALKKLLKNPDDSSNLVRQGDFWMHIKRKQFNEE